MRHLVIGIGNLGTDLVNKLREQGEEVTVGTRRDQAHLVFVGGYDKIWFTAGSGGPADSLESMIGHVETNVQTPAEIIRRAHDHTRLIFFSSHYLISDPQGAHSFYAKTKSVLEDMVVRRPGAVCYRVGSLYGTCLPKRTFPHKVLQNLAPITLPRNVVTPTPTDWLAEHLLAVERREMEGIHVLGPRGGVPVYKWGELITPLAQAGQVDPRYPYNCQGNTEGVLTPHWDDLWRQRADWFVRPRAEDVVG